jgi:MYXO-CTERM domain-containing protein
VTIERISFRPDATYGSAFATTLSDIQINLSTTSSSLADLTGVFADNIGSDDTIVVDRGALSLASSFTGPDDGPKVFDIHIDLDTPFLYDPTAGNLLLDVRNCEGQVDSYVFPVFDADYSNELWRGFTTNPNVDGVDSAEATLYGRGFGLVTQFTFTPIDTGAVTSPAPGAFLLTTIGLAGLAARRRRRPL